MPPRRTARSAQRQRQVGQVIARRPRADGTPVWLVRLPLGDVPAEEREGDGKSRRRRVYRSQTVVGPREEAEALLLGWRRQRERGALAPRSARERERARMTLGDVIQEWLDWTRRSVSRKTHAGYSQLLKLYVPDDLRAMRIAAITADVVQAVIADLASKPSPRTGRPYGPKTVQSVLIVLRMVFKFAVVRGLIPSSPAAIVRRPKVERRALPHLSVEQIRTFLKHADRDPFAVYWRLAIETGMRPGELLGLHWSDIHGNVVHVQRSLGYINAAEQVEEHEPKTRSSRRQIRLSPSSVAALARHRAEQNEYRLKIGPVYVDRGYVLARWNGSPLNLSTLHDHFQVLLRKAGLPHLRLYDLRHVAATLRLANGEHPKIVSELLGHSSTQITLDIYSHVTPDMQEAAAARFEALLSASPRRRLRSAARGGTTNPQPGEAR